jgi:broad-specificity NMP kinase
MIIWLNGPFGVGKTTTARALRQRLPNAVIADPERIGYVMKRTLWRKPDYQHVDVWRRLTVRQVAWASRRATAIVPMTVVEREIFDQITGGAKVFALTAERATIERRIDGTLESQRWRRDNLDRCLAAFAGDDFGERVPTEGLSPEAVADTILRRLALDGSCNSRQSGT